ncbi:MAG: helix-turn-helix transcriptional regulator [Patescibacteria group bacterium]|nr:helix-turn-helix transcriptional regulator [Patescibacteria group bacterium]
MPAEKKPNLRTYSGRIGAIVRKRRKDAGLSVEQFRDALRRRGVEIAISTIYGIENGNNDVDVNHLPAMAAVLGCESVLEILPPK